MEPIGRTNFYYEATPENKIVLADALGKQQTQRLTGAWTINLACGVTPGMIVVGGKQLVSAGGAITGVLMKLRLQGFDAMTAFVRPKYLPSADKVVFDSATPFNELASQDRQAVEEYISNLQDRMHFLMGGLVPIDMTAIDRFTFAATFLPGRTERGKVRPINTPGDRQRAFNEQRKALWQDWRAWVAEHWLVELDADPIKASAMLEADIVAAGGQSL